MAETNFNKQKYLLGISVLPFLVTVLNVCYCQLVVNIRNGGGDVVIESIHANTTDDTIELKFSTADGIYTSQLIDFNNEVQIFRVYVLGEEELGQNQYQCMCFVKRFMRNEFISSDAMSKLRQKNPTAIRVPEEDLGPEVKVMDMSVTLHKGHAISPHLPQFCKHATHSTYTNDDDIQLISKSIAKDLTTMLASVQHHEDMTNHKRCTDDISQSSPCICRYEICINWYPCGLKYCHGKDGSGRLVSYRCGIKTCRKCRVFDHLVGDKLLCVWDQI